jgi:hypothetical protein
MTAEGRRIMPAEAAIPTTPHRPLSRVIAEFASTAGERVSVEELTTALSDRSFAALIMLFSAPNLLPLPPGSSTIFGIPLIMIASQLLIGRSRLWLPKWLRERSLDGRTFSRIAAGIGPILRRIEKLAKPRYWPMPTVVAERFVGLVVLLMALVLVFPIPFGNWTPAVAAILVSLGLSERDGLWLGCGALVAAGSLGLAAGIIGSIGLVANGVLN